MIIGMDVREAEGQPAGKGMVVRELAQHLPKLLKGEQFRFYAKERFSMPAARNAEWESVRGKSVLWHRAAAKRAARECDVYLSTTSYVTPRFLSIPYVMVVYDLIAFKDFAVPQRRAKAIERATLGSAVKGAARILTISEATEHDLIGLFPAARGKTAVMPLAADERFRPHPRPAVTKTLRRYGLSTGYLLFTGTLEPRKNLVGLVQAYGNLPGRLRARHPLVLAGKPGWGFDSIFNAVRELDLEDQVRHLDYVPDEDLARLYAGAAAFVYPSLYEGFGLPVLEAMQTGVPTLTSDISSLPEVGGSAVSYVDPTNLVSITAGIERMLTDTALRRRLTAAGVRRAKEFSWKRTATVAAEALRAAA